MDDGSNISEEYLSGSNTNTTGTGDGGKYIRSKLPNLVAGGLAYLFIGFIVVWNNETAWQFLVRNKLPLGIAGGIVVVAAVVVWFQSSNMTSSIMRHVLQTFVALPILGILVAGILLSPIRYQVPMIRSFFVLIVFLLPATMYYLFIKSRKTSLLQEYLTNLSRLGLFRRQQRPGKDQQKPQRESKFERRVRLMSYINKFEAVYGPINVNLAYDLIKATDPEESAEKEFDFDRYSSGRAAGAIFTPETSIPVVLATLLIGLGWILILPPWEFIALSENPTMIEKLTPILQPGGVIVNFAFLGAYFYSLQMLFRRFVRKDLRANAYMAVALRIILAVIGTWAVIQAASILEFGQAVKAQQQALLVVAFVIGAFPPVAWQVIQAAFSIATGARFFVPSLGSEMPVSQLDGLTVWHEARLEEEDIENVPNMATADIVELMLHTRLPPDRIVDWVDQAILYTQLGSEKISGDESADKRTQRQRLSEHGIRTASALVAAYEKSKIRDDVDAFEQILPGDGRSRVRGLIDTLATNTNLELVRQWRRLLLSPSSNNQKPIAMQNKDKWEIYKDGQTEWRWRRTASNGQIVGTSNEGYVKKSDCIANAERSGYTEN